MATTASDGFSLTLLGVAGQGAQTGAPPDLKVATTVSSSVLKDLFIERLNTLVTLGIMTPAQVHAFLLLLEDAENGTLPPPTRNAKDPSEPVTPESVLRTVVLNAARRKDDTEDSLFSFLADAFITLGGGIYGAITEGSVDGFLQGASMAHQWAEDHIPTFV